MLLMLALEVVSLMRDMTRVRISSVEEVVTLLLLREETLIVLIFFISFFNRIQESEVALSHLHKRMCCSARQTGKSETDLCMSVCVCALVHVDP